MTIILTILTVISGILAVFFRTKANSANALANNQKASDFLNKTDQNLSKNKGLLEAEEAKRTEITHEEVKNVSRQELIDFVNNSTKS